VDDFELAEKRLLRLAAEVSPADWGRRSDPTRWSIAEGVLGRLWIISPFDARIRYNAYACLTFFRGTSLVTRGRRNRCGAGHRTG